MLWGKSSIWVPVLKQPGIIHTKTCARSLNGHRLHCGILSIDLFAAYLLVCAYLYIIGLAGLQLGEGLGHKTVLLCENVLDCALLGELLGSRYLDLIAGGLGGLLPLYSQLAGLGGANIYAGLLGSYVELSSNAVLVIADARDNSSRSADLGVVLEGDGVVHTILETLAVYNDLRAGL